MTKNTDFLVSFSTKSDAGGVNKAASIPENHQKHGQ